jgi:adenosylhomocysteinase
MPDGAIMANSGHFDAELDLTALERLAEGHVREVRNDVKEYDLGEKKLYMLAEDRLVNISADEGHHAAVMDMSFAGQALSVEYVAANHASLADTVHVVPPDIDAEIARLKLEARGIFIEGMTEEQIRYTNSWDQGT